MARIVATPSRPYTTPCDNPQQPCPECGGLECLCRPRFFAGQLLTDEDLNLLNHYIIEKNKLHNRYLHGWGVVCGMEVVCDPCSGVQVKPGYAISPCGEDIIVCKNQSVDVCSLINACKKPKNNCDPIDAYTANDRCRDTTEEWVLAIRYTEKATRGITSLKGASGSSCCSKCSCGGSSNCGCVGSSSSGGCGCGGSTQSMSTSSGGGGCGCGCQQSSSTMTTTTRAMSPPQCEPTAICESFVFEVCKIPPNAGKVAPVSPLVERLMCCLTLYRNSIPPFPTSNPPSAQDLQNWCCALRENLADLFAAHPGYACQLISKLGTLCQQAYQSLADIALAAEVYIVEFFRDCFCSALLPPCPAPVNDDRIYLATITVSRKDCTIIDICNWVRKFAVGFPMLAYWLSPLQLGTKIKSAISGKCCVDQAINTKFNNLNADVAAKVQTAQYPATAQQRSVILSQLISESFLKSQPVGLDTLAFANMGATQDGNPLLSDAQMQMPIEAMLLDQVAGPFLSGLETLTGIGSIAGSASSFSDVNALRDQMNRMQTTLDEQAKTIASLNDKLNQG